MTETDAAGATPAPELDGALRLEYRPLDWFKRFERNPKDHDIIGFLNGLMDQFGFTTPVLVCERTSSLAAGHGRLDTLEARFNAGEPPPQNITVDGKGRRWRVPVIRGWSSRDDDELRDYVIADNRSGELGGWIEHLLAEHLTRSAEGGTIERTGFDEDDRQQHLLNNLAGREQAHDSATSSGPGEFPEYGEDIPTQHQCPRCGYEWS